MLSDITIHYKLQVCSTVISKRIQSVQHQLSNELQVFLVKHSPALLTGILLKMAPCNNNNNNNNIIIITVYICFTSVSQESIGGEAMLK
jgi:hypothetical protein